MTEWLYEQDPLTSPDLEPELHFPTHRIIPLVPEGFLLRIG